uniref:Uncharacterized protein n=1 Tax=Anguilla anguilla TaxID=7936 RepID=A0A0E9XXI3_ANGAN
MVSGRLLALGVGFSA